MQRFSWKGAGIQLMFFRGGYDKNTLELKSLKPKTTKAKLISCVFFCLTTRPSNPTSMQVTSLKNEEEQ